MISQWVMDELQQVDLLDKRLEQRFRKLLDSLSQASTASIPAACDDRAEMVAAYRFFDNDKVQFENVLEPHLESSYLRVAKQRVALLVQDTAELDLTRPHSEVEGVDPLHNGNRCGALLHLLHAFTTDGTPLGTLAAEAWTLGVRQFASLAAAQFPTSLGTPPSRVIILPSNSQSTGSMDEVEASAIR